MMWVFAGITLAAVLVATFVNQIRQAILALWIAGLGIGALYLTVGAEFLAIIQWIVSTVVTISFVFFAVMFGEYNSSKRKKMTKVKCLLTLMTLILGIGFAAVIELGTRSLPEGMENLSSQMSDLVVIGKSLTQDHLLSLEVLALTLFLVLVGGGVIARPEGKD